MSESISPESRQEWITTYREAHKRLDNAQCKLSALINLLDGDPLADSLRMDPSEREGLHNLLDDIATQIADALYEELPRPDQFAELCGKGGRANV